MQKRRMVAATLALALPFAACEKAPDAKPYGAAATPATVFAAASLKELVTAIADEHGRRTGVTHKLQFDSTSTLARQIGEGAPADLFLTAAPEWLDKITTLERADWLSNRLVLVVPKDGPDVELAALPSLAIANEQVPAGKYARAALAHLKIALPERVVMGESVRDVLSKVSEGGAAAGIVYATDAAIDPKVRIASTFPADSHPKILYSIGLLTPAGKALRDALREPWALDLARKHGFEVP
jgi:molybdate transport system substrate-binding protein